MLIESVKLFVPEIFLSVVALLLLCVDVMRVRHLKIWVLSISLISLAAALFMVLYAPQQGRAFGMLVSDHFSMFFKVLAILGTIIVFLLSEKDPDLLGPSAGTFASLVILSTVGVMLLSSTEDLLILFIGLELTTVPLFILSGYMRGLLRANEGAIKFFLIGAFSTSLMIYGISFLYGLCGSTHFSDVGLWVEANHNHDMTLFLVGIFFLLVGLGFKFSLVPFHQWTPDTYEGAPTPITAFFSISRDAGVLVVLLRFFGWFVDHSLIGMTDIFIVLSIVTMTLGNITALRQNNLKRLLAYSSIAHAGTIFIGLVAGNAAGREGAMLYSFAYTLMSLGAFAVVILVARVKGSDDIDAVRGLGKERFGLALLMLFFLMSLSGIPPFLGFLGKFYVFAAAIDAGHYGLVAVGLINSVIAVYYYFRIVHKMFFQEPVMSGTGNYNQFSIQIVTVLTAAALLLLGIFPQGILSWVGATSQILP